MRILVVEDEKQLSREVVQYLTAERFHCDTAFTGKQASVKLAENPYDFVLIDIGLPDMNGLELIKEARKYNQEAYFIIITARGELNDKILGFEKGADDYLAKPFALPELNSRLQAIARRKFGVSDSVIKFGNFELDLNKKTVKSGDNTLVFTKKEYDLLRYLVLNKNRTLNRLQLTEHIWGEFFEDDYDSNYIDVHIKNVRKKLAQFDQTSFIRTERGLGYKFEMP